MATFRGMLEIEGEPNSGVQADIDVSHGHMKIWAGGSQIAGWDINEISIVEEGGVFRIVADREAVILRLNDRKRFAGAVGVTIHSDLDDAYTPSVIPAPVQRAPEDAPKIADEPLEMIVTPAPAPPPEPLRAKPPGRGPDDTPLARHLSWSLVGAGVVLFAGALLDWGPVRLTNSNFPIGRVLIVLAGFGTFAAAYLGLALEKRRDVALLALISAVIAVLVIIMFSRRAAIGWGFIVTILGSAAVIAVSVLALSQLGAPPEEPPEDDAQELLPESQDAQSED